MIMSDAIAGALSRRASELLPDENGVPQLLKKKHHVEGNRPLSDLPRSGVDQTRPMPKGVD